MGDQQRVAVIGAGISGLVTAKVFCEDGFDVQVFEKEATLGGVWSASHTYPGLRTNNTRETYAFTDFPYPEGTDLYPRAEQVRSYLESYADHFAIRDKIRFGAEVARVSRVPAVARPGGGDAFEVETRGPAGAAASRRFDYVVACDGVFSTPELPRFPGEERFAGPVLHSSQAVDPTLAKDKRVVVVGGGKSALDCAAWAAQQGRSSTLLVREPHWMVPRLFFGKVRSDAVIVTRFNELFLAYHTPSWGEAFLHRRLRPLVTLWWKGVGKLLERMTRPPEALRARGPLSHAIPNVGVGPDFYALVREGRGAALRGAIRRFTGPESIELESGEELKADLVVCATGWRQSVDFLDEELRDAVSAGGRYRLYRSILPPRVPGLGFVGYASSIQCQLTSEIGAHWLAALFGGALSLPPPEAMEEEIDRVLAWAERVVPNRPEGYFIGGFLAHYLDDLLRDMGVSTRRERNPLREFFGPLWAERYRGVGSERRRVTTPVA